MGVLKGSVALTWQFLALASRTLQIFIKDALGIFCEIDGQEALESHKPSTYLYRLLQSPWKYDAFSGVNLKGATLSWTAKNLSSVLMPNASYRFPFSLSYLRKQDTLFLNQLEQAPNNIMMRIEVVLNKGSVKHENKRSNLTALNYEVILISSSYKREKTDHNRSFNIKQNL